MYQQINEILTKIRNDRPVILNITNEVSMDFVANGLLSVGASPIMSKAMSECSDLLKIASAVVINIGTLNDAFIELSHHVCHEANRLGIPITLDPVGAGASNYRTKACHDLLEQFHIAIIRGNAGEIMALSGIPQNTKGVDSTVTTDKAIEHAQKLSAAHQVLVTISGKTDAIIDINHVRVVDRGAALMPRITGSGCLLSAIISTFDAMHSHRHSAVSAAALFYSVCGEIAARTAKAPGSFKVHFIDALSFTPQSNDYD